MLTDLPPLQLSIGFVKIQRWQSSGKMCLTCFQLPEAVSVNNQSLPCDLKNLCRGRLVLKSIDLEDIFNLLEWWGAGMGKPPTHATFLLYSPLEVHMRSYQDPGAHFIEGWFLLISSGSLEPSLIMDPSWLCGLSRLKISENASDFESRG